MSGGSPDRFMGDPSLSPEALAPLVVNGGEGPVTYVGVFHAVGNLDALPALPRSCYCFPLMDIGQAESFMKLPLVRPPTTAVGEPVWTFVKGQLMEVLVPRGKESQTQSLLEPT